VGAESGSGFAGGTPGTSHSEIVEKLDLDRCNRKHRHTAGEPAYDARLMTKVLIYAYARGITSSREMARQCEVFK
jgi:transposase